MTYNEDFAPVDDVQAVEDPSYPVAFGVELTPKIQGIGIALLGLVGAFFLYTRVVQPAQEEKTEIEQRVADKEEILRNQEASLEEIESVRAELERALEKREAIYSLLGDASSLDTLLLDINQVIKSSNASIERAIATDFDTLNATQLASFGLTPTQIQRIRTEFAEDPIRQRLFYTSELWQFNPDSASGVIQDELYGPELLGKLERQVVEINLRSLFGQAQTIIRNLERLEPLVIIRDFEQEWAEINDVDDELLQGLTRPLETNFTLEVLVPVGDPREPPELPEPEATEEGEGEAGEGTADGGS